MASMCAVAWCIAAVKAGSRYCVAHAIDPTYEPRRDHQRSAADENDGDLDFDGDDDEDDDDAEDDDDELDEDDDDAEEDDDDEDDDEDPGDWDE